MRPSALWLKKTYKYELDATPTGIQQMLRKPIDTPIPRNVVAAYMTLTETVSEIDTVHATGETGGLAFYVKEMGTAWPFGFVHFKPVEECIGKAQMCPPEVPTVSHTWDITKTIMRLEGMRPYVWLSSPGEATAHLTGQLDVYYSRTPILSMGVKRCLSPKLRPPSYSAESEEIYTDGTYIFNTLPYIEGVVYAELDIENSGPDLGFPMMVTKNPIDNSLVFEGTWMNAGDKYSWDITDFLRNPYSWNFYWLTEAGGTTLIHYKIVVWTSPLGKFLVMKP